MLLLAVVVVVVVYFLIALLIGFGGISSTKREKSLFIGLSLSSL